MRSLRAMSLVLVIGVGLPTHAHAHDDGEILDITPADVAFTLEMRFPNHDEGSIIPDAPCSVMISVPNVVTGQRVPVPRTVDGACPRRFSTEIVNAWPLQVEFEPAGCMEEDSSTCTHFITHDLATETSESVDPERCEVVIDEATARETVRRKPVRHLTSLERDYLLGQPPAPADLREPQRPEGPLFLEGGDGTVEEDGDLLDD
jgi:hypothetical protein